MVFCFQKAISNAPNEPYPHYELGFTLCKIGQIEEGLQEFRITNKLSEGFYLVQTELFLYESFMNKSIDEIALTLCREILQLNDLLISFNQSPHYWPGPPGPELIPKLDQLTRKLRERFPNFALSELFFARHALEESTDNIRASLEQCLALNPDDTTKIYAMYYLSGLCSKNDPDKATDILLEVARLFPNNPHVQGIKYFLDQKMFDKALSSATREFRLCGYEYY